MTQRISKSTGAIVGIRVSIFDKILSANGTVKLVNKGSIISVMTDDNKTEWWFTPAEKGYKAKISETIQGCYPSRLKPLNEYHTVVTSTVDNGSIGKPKKKREKPKNSTVLLRHKHWTPK